MSVRENLSEIRKDVPAGVTLIAVSKTKPNEAIEEAYQAGQRVFGENKPQELTQKWADLPKDIEWHMIGHLQTNKVKYIAPFVALIHSVDSPKLLAVIDKEAAKCGRVIDCLFQMYIAQEETKFGFDYAELAELLESGALAELRNVRMVGVMGMATFTDNVEQVRGEFHNLKEIYTKIKQKYYASEPSFKEISMGMSDDFRIAIEEGSTMVRVGSAIFGGRVYLK
ncbi:YggS family pyridoxal phosphate-dependent enzyme [uncultured Acetobacteroides sp.]|uniref:YggS family pyridoxal phosphate-dependent enzyme n=1 Tax=uncultured Acetobacteroides sp. TaxID=1760811 RepID=UPI0029F5B4D8|nr:YggS family pyridoxal phosphate-dependent enzyme [uncultured Acetobacteroides sp.]